MLEFVQAVFIVLLALTWAAAAGLFGLKWVRSRRSEKIERRRARYEELMTAIAIGGPVDASLHELAEDPVFRDVLLDYARFLQGSERTRLLALAREEGIVDAYRDQLRSRSKETRVRAAQALTELADPATVPSLIAALADRVPEVRVQVVGALANIGEPSSIPFILERLEGEREWNALRIADSLVGFGKAAVPEVSRYLLISDPFLGDRYLPLAARVLGTIGDFEAEPALLQVVEGGDLELRIRATEALGRAGTHRSMDKLLELLEDEHWEIRTQAASALGRRMDARAAQPLRKSLRDRSWWVRYRSALALVSTPGGIEELADALTDSDPYAADMAAWVLVATGTLQKAIGEGSAERAQVPDMVERAGREDLLAAEDQAGVP